MSHFLEQYYPGEDFWKNFVKVHMNELEYPEDY